MKLQRKILTGIMTFIMFTSVLYGAEPKKTISANCGLAVRVETEYTDKIKNIVKDENIKVTISLVEKHGLKKHIEKIHEVI